MLLARELQQKRYDDYETILTLSMRRYGKGLSTPHTNLLPIRMHTLSFYYVSVRNLSRGTHVHYLGNLYKKYGQVISFRAGVQTLIWINDGKLLSELFKTEQMALRPIEILPVLQQLSGGSSRGW